MSADMIETVHELVLAVSDAHTGGYICDMEVQPNLERARHGDGFFLVITVEHSEPGPRNIDGEWWFDANGVMMQVL